MKAGDMVQWMESLTSDGEVIWCGVILLYRDGARTAKVLIPDVGVEWRSIRGMKVINESR